MSRKNANGDLVSRSALLKTARRYEEYDEGGWSMTVKAVPVEAVEAAEAVDAVPVVHGRWEIGGMQGDLIGNWECSVCGKVSLDDSDYCPNCGAMMRGESDEAE